MGGLANRSIFGTDQEYKDRLNAISKKLNEDLGTKSGAFGAGTVFDSPEQAGNISAADLTKKIVGTGAGVVGEVGPLGGAGKAAEGASIGAKIIKPLAFNAAEAGLGSAGSQLALEGKIDAKRTAIDTGIGAGFGVGSELASPLISKAVRPMVRLKGNTTDAITNSIGKKVDDAVAPTKARVLLDQLQGKNAPEPVVAAPKARDLNFNDIQQVNTVARLKQLNEQKAKLKPNTPQYKANQLEIKKGLRDLDELNMQASQQADLDFEASRPKVNPEEIEVRKAAGVDGQVTPISPRESAVITSQSNSGKDLAEFMASGKNLPENTLVTIKYQPPGSQDVVTIQGKVKTSYGGKLRNDKYTSTHQGKTTAYDNYASEGRTIVTDSNGNNHVINNEDMNGVEIHDSALVDGLTWTEKAIARMSGISEVDFAKQKLANQPTKSQPISSVEPSTTPAGADAQGRQFDANGEYIADAPVVQPTTPVAESKLGYIARDFYDSRKGNQAITRADTERLGQEVSKQIDNDFRDIGSDFSTVAQKVETARRAGAKSLDEVDITPDEASLWRNALEELNYIRRRQSVGKKEISAGDYGEMYFPNQTKEARPDTLVGGFKTDKPGNEFSRTDAINLEDLDYSPDVLGGYVTRYADTKLYNEQRIFNAMKKANPNVDEGALTQAASELSNIQDEANQLVQEVGKLGFGKREIKFKNEKFDIAAKVSEVGKMVGKQQIEVTDVARGLTVEDKLNSVKINGTPLSEVIGLKQWNESQNFASSQWANAGDDPIALARMVEQRLMNDYNIDPDSLEYAVKGIAQIAPTTPPEVALARVVSTYKAAAKQQILETLQTLDIKDPKLRGTVSDITNQILREGTIESSTSSKVVSGILKAQNTIFRKLNVGSAINELGDLPSFLSAYGRNTDFTPDFGTIKEFGLGEIDASIESYVKAINNGANLKSVLSSINDKTNLYRFVEHYKAAVVASSAKSKYMADGLTGDALTKAVVDDYRKIALPVDAFTKTALDNYPLYTQYLSWGARNLQKEGKLATGKLEVGALKDMTQTERALRNAYVNLPAKTVFWLSSNALKGTAIMTAFGLTDFTGMTSQDYSGIAEEDKSWYDKTTKYTNNSTTLSLLNNVVQSIEKENLKNSDKYKNAEYNPYENNNLVADIAGRFEPQVIKNVTGTKDMMDKGYAENKSGKVQFEAPNSIVDTAKSYVFGKNNTKNAREYSGKKNVIERTQESGNPLTAIRDMAAEDLGFKENNYNRPLNDTYSEKYKNFGVTEKAARTALLQGGRQFNKYLDDLKKNDPNNYQDYIKAMDTNHVSPEYWREIAGKDGQDLTTFKTLRDRKKQLNKDMGTPYDPVYDLPDDQAKAVLALKGTATGSDIAMRNMLNKEQWYKDFQKKVTEYYKVAPEGDGEGFNKSERVKSWEALDQQQNAFYSQTDAEGAPAEWTKKYPLVSKQKAITEQYGFDSQESKNFFKSNADGYKAEKAQLNSEKLDIINKMRAIEGQPPMSAEAYAQATEIADTDGEDSKSGWKNYSKNGRSGGGGRDGVGSVHKYDVKLSAGEGFAKAKVSTKASRKVKAARKTAKPKVAIKRSAV